MCLLFHDKSVDKAACLHVPRRDYGRFVCTYRLDRIRKVKVQPQIARGQVVDLHRFVTANSRDLVTKGGHAPEIFGTVRDGSHNSSPAVRPPIKPCDNGFPTESPGVKPRRHRREGWSGIIYVRRGLLEEMHRGSETGTLTCFEERG